MAGSRNYFIWTIGCQMNVADSQRLAAALERVGYVQTASPEEADLIVLNTCVVRQSAEDKVYGRLGSLRPIKTRRPETIVALMGCLVGTRANEPGSADLQLGHPPSFGKRFPWVDVFLPPSDPGPLLDLLTERGLVDEARALAAESQARRYGLADDALLLPEAEQGKLVSAYIPVVLGCSHACTYCIIPYRRGRERSRLADEIVGEACSLSAQGVREVTLLGQIVDRYGYDLLEGSGARGPGPKRTPLVELLERISDIDGIERIRFLTSHPNWLADDLLEAVARLPKVCEHIEVPVQAGDDEVLARMRRGYTADAYRALVARIRSMIPSASIATDIIVGFPGETEAQFGHTYSLLAELSLDKAHIARYSSRSQTFAARQFDDDVPAEEKERRRKSLDDLQASIVSEINAALLGSVVEVLVEGRKKGRWWGRTRSDKLVFFESDQTWLGQLAPVRITWAGPWSLIGQPDTPPRSRDA